ncbi:beta strand repeat-containing protein [Acidocella aminolytica]|uniref:beta strand repeat-containing protein n=1 Tax=Acidocella aminolytica TaxID=33998 RepID=UPI000910731E|nr:hypothetical protein [Acidocella aminolytica]SHF45848.1 autotransporter passenger strand-loop-strand repeat-containing protein [Acidocella aminolytica 101 = DSM 11237]
MPQTIVTSLVVSGTLTSPVIGWGGTLSVSGGAELNSASLLEDAEHASDPIIDVGSLGSISNTTIRAGDGVFVTASGTASNSFVQYAGVLDLQDGGTATNSLIEAGGAELVASGGVSNNTTIIGGVGQGTTINVLPFSQGMQVITAGGIAENTYIGNGGIADVYSGGVETNATLSTSGTSIIHSGGIGNDLNVQAGGELIIENGGTLNGASVAASGTLLALPGSTINSITGQGSIITEGVVRVQYRDGYAPVIVSYGSTLNSGVLNGKLIDYALYGGTVDKLSVSGGSTLIGYSGSTLNSDYIQNTGTEITSGGYSSNLIVNAGLSEITENGINSTTTIQNGGREVVMATGTATGSIILSNGSEQVEAGGVAVGSTIGLGGIQNIESGGYASGTVIKAGGIEIVSNGGTLANPTVQQGGILIDLNSKSSGSPNTILPHNEIIDINKTTGNYDEISGSSNITIASGHYGVVSGSLTNSANVTVDSGGTLDVTAGSTLASVELNGGLIHFEQGASIGSVTIEVGSPGTFTNDSTTDISSILNEELRSVPTGTSITVIFNPGDYAASSTVYLGSDTSVIGNSATFGALSGFSGNALFENYDNQWTGATHIINNIDGSQTVVDQGIGGGELSNLITTTNNASSTPSTTVQPELPLLSTNYASADSSTPVVDTNISIRGMTLVETGDMKSGRQAMIGTNYGSVGRGVWFTGATNLAINNNIMIGGVSGMSLVNDSNGVVAQNIILGSTIPVDMWSGASNFLVENNQIWEYSSSNPSGSTGAIQLNASTNAFPSNPGVNNSGTTINDAIIGNNITGIGQNTAAMAVDPLYSYGATSETNITEQGNISNSLGNSTGGYYTANVQSATITDNLYVGDTGKIQNLTSAYGTTPTTLTTSNGNISGNLILTGVNASSNLIGNEGIDPTTVDNAVIGSNSASSDAISSWGFTGTNTESGNVVSGRSGTSTTSVQPNINISTPSYLIDSSGTIEISGSNAPIISDANSQFIYLTISSVFGTITSGSSFANEYSTVVGGESEFIIDGSIKNVNEELSSLTYVSSLYGTDDALKISLEDSYSQTLTKYIPILNTVSTGSAETAITIASGFTDNISDGNNLSGEMVVTSGQNNIVNMGSTVSSVFTKEGNSTLNAGTGSEYISMGSGRTLVNLGAHEDITIVGGTGQETINGTSTDSSDSSLIETGYSNAYVTAGGGASTVVAGYGNVTFIGGSGPTLLTTLPNESGTLQADMGAGNSTIYALSGIANIHTQANTNNNIMLGSGQDSIFSGGADSIAGGSGSLYVQASSGNISLTAGTGSSTILAGTGTLNYTGNSGTTYLVGASTPGGMFTAHLGSGNSTILGGADDGVIETQLNTSNVITTGTGNDTIISAGSDSVTGGSGSLYVQADTANTSVAAGSGSSTLLGGLGELIYQGGSGNSYITMSPKSRGELVANLGTGNSTINTNTSDAIIDTAANSYNVISAGSGINTIVSGGHDLINASSGTVLIKATGNAQDTVVAGTGSIVAENLSQNGNLYVDFSGNNVVTVNNKDTITVFDGNYTVTSPTIAYSNESGNGIEVISLVSYSASKTLYNTSFIQNHSGVLSYSVSSGSGSVYASGGQNSILVGGNSVNRSIISSGNDTITFNVVSGEESVSSVGNATTSVLIASSDNVSVAASDSSSIQVRFLKGSGGTLNFINHSNQVATIFSSTYIAGNQSVQFVPGAVTAFGGSTGLFAVGGDSGYNSINGGTGSSTIVGSGYGDTLMASGQQNYLFGGQGAETLLGSGGMNVFVVGVQEPVVGAVTAVSSLVSTGGSGKQVFFLGNMEDVTLTGSTVTGASNDYIVQSSFTTLGGQAEVVKGGSFLISDFGGNSTISLNTPGTVGTSVQAVSSLLGGGGTQILLTDGTLISLTGVGTTHVSVNDMSGTITYA